MLWYEDPGLCQPWAWGRKPFGLGGEEDGWNLGSGGLSPSPSLSLRGFAAPKGESYGRFG
jgi:hypothetical protein